MKKIYDFFKHPISNIVVGILFWLALFFVYEPLKSSGQFNLPCCFLGAGMFISIYTIWYGFVGYLFSKDCSDKDDTDE